MIVLDMNVLSELMRPKPATKVVDWMAAGRRFLPSRYLGKGAVSK